MYYTQAFLTITILLLVACKKPIDHQEASEHTTTTEESASVILSLNQSVDFAYRGIYDKDLERWIKNPEVMASVVSLKMDNGLGHIYIFHPESKLKMAFEIDSSYHDTTNNVSKLRFHLRESESKNMCIGQAILENTQLVQFQCIFPQNHQMIVYSNN